MSETTCWHPWYGLQHEQRVDFNGHPRWKRLLMPDVPTEVLTEALSRDADVTKPRP
jgi:hypothetical protein